MEQVIVVNGALNLPPGKMAAQVAHAGVGTFLQGERQSQEA
jgi:PTH2 family peptidyl-tRNA hydrolase